MTAARPMKRILLVYAVSHRIQTPLLGVAGPSGLTWVARALDRHGYESSLCDLTFARDRAGVETLLKDQIAGFRPDAVGVSIRNIDTATDPPKTFYPFLEHVASTVRAATDVPMILGGSGFSLYPAECMQRLHADYGVVGEGEHAFPQLLAQLSAGVTEPDTPGTLYWRDGRLQQRDRAIFEGFTQIGAPLHRGVDYNRYDRIGGYYSVQTKRGCAFKCVYCDYPFLEGKKYRMRDHREIVDEMESLIVAYDLRHFFFTDSVFNFPVRLCESILREIVRRRLDLRWTAYVNPRGLTRELVELFKRSGCERVEVTADSAAGPTLETYQKHFGVDEIKKADQYLHEFEIPSYYWINLGGPGETQSTLDEGFETLNQLLNVTKGWLGTGFVVHPGTPLYDIAKLEGRISGVSGNEPYLYLSKLLPEDFAEQVQRFCAEHPAWYSRYDRLNDDYMAMVRKITRENIRNHWVLQNEYGRLRRERYRTGALPIYSHKDFQARVAALGATWAKGAVE